MLNASPPRIGSRDRLQSSSRCILSLRLAFTCRRAAPRLRSGNIAMRTIIVSAAVALTLAAAFAPEPSQAGCLTGAAVGGVAGHMAGHHAVLGAAAGCAVGHHEASKAAKAKAAQQQQQSGQNDKS
jgi:hypothetical protein